MHGGEPLRDDASIRDFNGSIGCHIASAIEEALLLPKDMAEIKNVRKNQLILDNKRYLGMVRNYFLYIFFLHGFIVRLWLTNVRLPLTRTLTPTPFLIDHPKYFQAR